jgi:hypothetical protein
MTSLTSAQPHATAIPGETIMAQSTVSNRFLLWIDAVGGYLVCSGNRVRIGQMAPGGVAELPIVADLARHHATFRRDGDSYLIEPIHPVKLNDRAVDRTMLVAPRAKLEFGRGVQFSFSQPNPLSGTACLQIVSRHRTQPTTSGMILLADTCVLGPEADSHIVCRNWSRKVVLHRLQDSLYCVTDGPFSIDGTVCQRRGLLKPGSQVIGEDFTFSIEAF